MSDFSNKNLPKHVAIIMDGNGRWAKKHLLVRSLGHNAGMKNLIALAEHIKDLGIPYLTVYALSTENMARPKEEVDNLIGLIRTYFKSQVKRLQEVGAGVKILGDISVFPQDVRQLLSESEQTSPANAPFTLSFALNYGGRAEIVRAVNRAVQSGETVDEKTFSSMLFTAGLPDPDLIIRTGGEQRISNFLIYQAAYAEFYFTDVLFPDFTAEECDKALSEYARRHRTFGLV